MRAARLALAAALLLLTAGATLAAEAPPAELHAALAALRAHRQDNPDTLGATAAFDPIKHRLRDWLFARLPAQKPTADSVTALAGKVSTALKEADLLCPPENEGAENGPCTANGQFFPLGYLDEVELELRDYGERGIFLVAKTGIGVFCGFDASAYVFEWKDGAWRLAWQSEQNDYTGEHYRPGGIGEVQLGPADETGQTRLVLTLGSNPACQSFFQTAYVRLWRMGSKPEEARLLLDGAEAAYLGRNEPALLGDVGPDDALVEFATPSLDIDVHNRETVLHFKASGDTVERVDPIALSPRDFVEEWLRRPWEESARWTEPKHREEVGERYRALHEGVDYVSGSFVPPTRACTVRPGLWQVALALGAAAEDRDQRQPTYFLVRWQPPFRFRMADVAERPFPECFQPDTAANAWRTLFAGHGWQ